jgi:hypothetical protein
MSEPSLKSETCKHSSVYVASIKPYFPRPLNGGKPFSVEIICLECEAHMLGQVVQVMERTK